MIRLQMLNGDQHDLTHHGSVSNQRRWCRAYVIDQDIVLALLFWTDDCGLEQVETYCQPTSNQRINESEEFNNDHRGHRHTGSCDRNGMRTSSIRT